MTDPYGLLTGLGVTDSDDAHPFQGVQPKGEGRKKSMAQLSLSSAAPPPPRIFRNNTTLSAGSHAKFAFEVVDDPRCIGYAIYRGAVDNAKVAERITFIAQPGDRAEGTLTYDDPSPDAFHHFYWICSVNAAGTESARIGANTKITPFQALIRGVGINDYVLEGSISTIPASGLTMTIPQQTVYVDGNQVTVLAQTYTYPASKFISDEVTATGQLVHNAYDSYIDIPAIPASGGVRIQQVETNATDIISVFDRRTLEPNVRELFSAAFRWQKIVSLLEIDTSEGNGNSYPTGTLVKNFTGAYRYATGNGILWYFSNLGLYFLVGHLDDAKIKTYLDVYIANLDSNYIAWDVFANPDYTLDVNTTTGDPSPARNPDSHDSYAATFLMLAVRYLRQTNDWDWLDTVNANFGESNLQTLLNISLYNITSQIKTSAWCIANGFAVDFPNGRNTLLVNTFQDGVAPGGGAYDISFTGDNSECYRGLKDLGDLLTDIGEPNAATILAHAANIGIAVHGLYDLGDRKWVWHDGLDLINWADTNPDTWLADATNVGTALYPDIFGSVFPELWNVPSAGGEVADSQRYNDAWEFLNLSAPGWYERAEYDSFPNNFYGYLAAARRKDYPKASKSLEKFLKYYINLDGPQFIGDATLSGDTADLSGNTSGTSLLSEVGFGVGIQDNLIVAMSGHIEDSDYPYTALTVKKLRSLQQVALPLRKQSLTAGTAVKPNALSCPIGSTANVTITATPSIETSGVEGDTLLILYNVDNVFIEFQDESALAGSKLRLGASSIKVNQYEAIHFIYSISLGAWLRINNRADSVLTGGAVSDVAYDATTWDAVTTIAPSKNSVRDKFESIISDTAFAGSWDGVTGIAPSKNAVYDKMNTLATKTTPGAQVVPLFKLTPGGTDGSITVTAEGTVSAWVLPT